MGEIVPAEITIFQDGSFRFDLKSPPTSFLIKRAAGIQKGASNPATETVATLTRQQVREIAEMKFKDLNALDIDAAMRQIEGTARQMGIKVAD
jgi:large subunit ribosomal protein L11